MFGIGSLFGKMFGTEKALSGIVDGVTNSLDKLVYTDEEKAGDAAAERTEGRQMVVQWMQATQGQNLARRFIALSVVGVWLSMYLLSVLMEMIAVFLVNPENVTAVSKIAFAAAKDMNTSVMLVMGFYFAAPHMGDIASSLIGKMSSGPANRSG